MINPRPAAPSHLRVQRVTQYEYGDIYLCGLTFKKQGWSMGLANDGS